MRGHSFLPSKPLGQECWHSSQSIAKLQHLLPQRKFTAIHFWEKSQDSQCQIQTCVKLALYASEGHSWTSVIGLQEGLCVSDGFCYLHGDEEGSMGQNDVIKWVRVTVLAILTEQRSLEQRCCLEIEDMLSKHTEDGDQHRGNWHESSVKVCQSKKKKPVNVPIFSKSLYRILLI